MADDIPIEERVRAAAAKRILFLPHAVKAMVRVHPMITPAEVEAVVTRGKVIEDYPEDVRGHSCLMLAAPGGRAIHVVCSPKVDYLAVITTYRPDPALWKPDFRERKR